VSAELDEVVKTVQDAEFLLRRVRVVADSMRSLAGEVDRLRLVVEHMDRDMTGLDTWVTQADARLARLEGRE
jgi:hypothetical protein